ncbi:ABC-type glycerol-3-phosphate transport system substrate-binding protein [Catenibacillus scindens]|uniref:ABC-type glycerol-3-phosphate transport system substrate-binding protein n=1 Tax=Catenibacillus scindens TaxID=673271 RepID=A0A7W8M6H8_9FIRM|nr:extracellular solute-binding protein [Catenibacillus scindens]MBB5266110.1 ABC-type glycerol-3-phosphate transport system substrate-binding protein [Catenibacillus scindens]
MKTKKLLRIEAAAVAAALALALAAGCAEQTPEPGNVSEEVSIPVILTVDSSTGIRNEEKLINAFNQLYNGRWQADVEWIMETEEEYRQNLKRQNVTDTLPALITDLRMLPSFYYMMIEDGRIEELSKYIEADEEWKAMIEPSVLASCREEDGSIYLGPISTAAFACSGMFWNEELFAQAGIESFPETWEEFWQCCEQLKSCGITPLALHTEGTAWAPMLIATAEVASTEEGADFMQQFYPETYQNESGLRIAKTLQKLFSYTTEDALYRDFDVAYENFFSGQAAMIPNGYWMMDQVPEKWQDKVRFSAFPENKLISSPETFGWAIVSSYSEEVKEGAAALLKLRTRMNMEQREELFSKDPSEMIPAERDYIAVYKNSPQLVPNYQVKWNSILQEDTLGEILPELVQNKMTPEEFTAREDESIRRFLEEQ